MLPRSRLISQLTVLGTGDLMPALVYGFESTEMNTYEGPHLTLTLDFEPPNWLFGVFVQAGGYCMSYYSIVGAVFRLADNVRHAFRDPAPVLRAFHLMAEDPDTRALTKEYPKLLPITGTWGGPYDSDQLRRVGNLLGRCFSLPAPKGGLEAFVRLGTECSEEMFGWTHLHAKTPPQILEDRGAADGVLTGDPFGPGERAFLQNVGAQAFPGVSGPELFLVWENSD